MDNNKDPRLWELARKRASFKYHLLVYAAIIAFLWVMWVFQGGIRYGIVPWPVWPTLGWGIGLAFHFMSAYVFAKEDEVEKEYQRLLREKQKL